MCSECEFSYAGCGAEFIRDHQKEHMEQNTQKHLALVAAATQKISQAFEQKLQEQQREFDQKLEDKDSEIKAIVNNEASQLVNEQRQQTDAQIRNLHEKLQEQQHSFQQSLEEKERQIKELQKMLEKKLGEQREEFHKQQRKLEEKLEEKDQRINSLEEQQIDLQIAVRSLPYNITVSNFGQAKLENRMINSLPLSTHSDGYHFYLSLRPNGPMMGDGWGTHVAVWVYYLRCYNEDKLKFPAWFTITLELLNQHTNRCHHTKDIQCEVTSRSINGTCIGGNRKLISHALLDWSAQRQSQYLKNDCLKFRITKVIIS